MKIRTRLLLLLIPAIFFVLSLLVLLTYYNASRQARELATAEARRVASAQSALVFDKLHQAEAVGRALASTLAEMAIANGSRENMSLAIKGAAASSKDFFGIWALWEKNAFDNRDAEFVGNEEVGNSEGRANAYWLRGSDNSLGYDISENYDNEPYYTQPKNERRMTIIPPYRDNNTKEKTLMSTISVPILDNNTFLGAVGVDIEMEFIKRLLKSVKPFETGYALLISDTGDIVSDPNQATVEETLPKVAPDILAKIKKGEPFVVSSSSALDGADVRCFYSPIKLESFAAPWYFMVALPVDKVMAESNRNLAIQLGISVFALGVLIFLVFYTADSVARLLQRIVTHANNVASGNYGSTLDSRGFVLELTNLAAALNSMLSSLMDTMRQVEESSAESARGAEKARQATAEAEEARQKTEASHIAMLKVASRVDAVSQKVRGTSHELTAKITNAGEEALEQNKLMDETVGAITAMSDSIVCVSGNAEDAAKFTQRTGARASEGSAVVNKTLDAIEDIRNEIETLGTQISGLSQNAEAVGAILGLINDIADQTNLLALNAAIEAARAGESGRGFAVVADEVRKLAEKTMEATRQVDDSIKNIRSSMRISAEGVERVSRTVLATVSLGNEARESLEDIVNLVQGMNDQIRDIAVLCREQAATSEQVSSVVERLRQLSVSAGEAMRESADIADTLAPEAKELGLLVEQLTTRQ